MRKDFGSKTWLYPMPVLILAAYGENGEPMAMNVGWAGICGEHRVMLGLGKDHKTTEYLLKTGAFTLSPATRAQLAACDYVGIDSGRDVPDKMAKSGFHAARARTVNAPSLEELPLTLECRLLRYDPEEEILVGSILNVSADQSILDENGRIDGDKARFLTLDPGNLRYRILGPTVGKAFRDGLSLSDKGKAKPFDDLKPLP